MATIVDALLVTLGLDTKEYEKGTKKAEKSLADFDKKRTDSEKRESVAKAKEAKEEDRRNKEAEAQRKKTYESLGKIRNQVVGIMTLFTAGQGLLAFAKSSIDTAANLGRLSDNTKMAVDDLAGLEQAFSRTGGSAQEAQSTIAMLTKNLSNMQMGMESNVSEFLRFGGNINQGQLNSTKEYLFGIADLLHKINKENPSKAWMVAGRLGLSDTAFNLMKQGRKALEAQMAAGARMSGLNKQQADEAREVQKAWADMASMMASIGRAILFPMLKELGGWMKSHQKDIDGWLASLREFISKMTPKTIEGIGKAFKDVADAIKSIAEALKGMRALTDKLGLTTAEGGAPEQAKPTTTGGRLMQPFIMAMKGMGWAREKLIGGTPGGSTSNVSIGQITVNTRATDANGVAAGIHDALKQRGLTMQANGAGG